MMSKLKGAFSKYEKLSAKKAWRNTSTDFGKRQILTKKPISALDISKKEIQE